MNIQANGISINYELSGSGRYFTLIHGAGDNLNAWYNQVPAFSRYYRVLTYDVRGHGQTELPEGELTMELWVEDLYALLKTLSINETVLLGFSMGGAIAIRFTLEHPDIIKALILSNSGGLAAPVQRSDEEIRQMESRRQAQLENIRKEGMEAVVRDRIGRTFSPGFAEKNPEAVERYKSVLLQNNPEGYLRVMQRMGGAAEPPDLSKVSCPALIVSGENDPFGSQSGRTAQEAIPGSRLVTFPTGHYTPLEQPQEYNKAVLGFLNEVGLG